MSRQSLEREVNISNLDILRQTRTATDSILEATEQLSLQVIGNRDMDGFIDHEIDISKFAHVQVIKNLSSSMETLFQGAQYVERISVCSILSKVAVSTGAGMYSVLDNENVERITKDYKYSSSKMWLVQEKGSLDENRGSIQLIQFINSDNNYPIGFVTITLKSEETSKLIQEFYIRQKGFIMLLDEKGRSIINGNKNLGKPLGNLHLDALRVSGDEGYRKVNINGDNLLISYTTSKYNGWKYVALLPADELNGKAEVIRNVFMLICLFFTVISGIWAYAIAKGIYNPIFLIQSVLKGETPGNKKMEKLNLRKDEFGQINKEISRINSQLNSAKILNESVNEEKNALKGQLDENESKLKNYFLYRLICGDVSEKGEIEAQANFLNIPLNARFLVLILEFDKNFDEQTSVIEEKNKKVIKSGVLEMFENTIKRVALPIKVFFETVENRERLIGIISLKQEYETESTVQVLKVQCNFLQNIILSNFEFSISIAVGKMYQELHEIRKSYEEAVQAMKYKFLLGSNIIIFKEELDKNSMDKLQQYSYKKHLKNSLHSGNKGEVIKVLLNLKSNLKETNTPINECVFYFLDIINILIEYLNDLGYKYSQEIKELNSVFQEFGDRFESIDEATDWVYSFIERAFNKGNGADGHKVGRLVSGALIIIESEYHNDISLSYISDKLDVSEQYLSKVFRDEIGQNFKKYLTMYKIKKAKELLRNTDIQISEIVGMVGYNNHSQFTRMFRRLEGITAAEYRALYLNESQNT